MAKMREKNEAIRKRYDEVQEDLKNAQTISSQVKVEDSGSEDESRRPVRKAVNKTPPRDQRETQKFTPRRQTSSEPKEQQSQDQQPPRAVHAFNEGEGPPPDPGYNFLADEERDGPKDNKEQKEKAQNKNNPAFSGRGGSFKQRGPRNPRQRGGHRGGRSFSGSEDFQPSHERHMPDKDQKWREERAAIDEARMKRGLNQDGNWRREWDNDKAETQNAQQQSSSRGDRGGGRGRGGSGNFQGQSQRGNGTKFFYQRGRGGNHSQGESNFRQDRWERDAPETAPQQSAPGASPRDLRDVINSRKTGSFNGAGKPFGGSRAEPLPQRKNVRRHADQDDEWEDVE